MNQPTDVNSCFNIVLGKWAHYFDSHWVFLILTTPLKLSRIQCPDSERIRYRWKKHFYPSKGCSWVVQRQVSLVWNVLFDSHGMGNTSKRWYGLQACLQWRFSQCQVNTYLFFISNNALKLFFQILLWHLRANFVGVKTKTLLKVWRMIAFWLPCPRSWMAWRSDLGDQVPLYIWLHYRHRGTTVRRPDSSATLFLEFYASFHLCLLNCKSSPESEQLFFR